MAYGSFVSRHGSFRLWREYHSTRGFEKWEGEEFKRVLQNINSMRDTEYQDAGAAALRQAQDSPEQCRGAASGDRPLL